VIRRALLALPLLAAAPLAACGSTDSSDSAPPPPASVSTSAAATDTGASPTSTTPSGGSATSVIEVPPAAEQCFPQRRAGATAVVEPIHVRKATTLTSAALTGTTGLRVTGPVQLLASQDDGGLAGPVAPETSVKRHYDWSTRTPAAGAALTRGTWELYFPLQTETVASYGAVRLVTADGTFTLRHAVTLTDDPKGCGVPSGGSGGPPIEGQ
jgi:hypothetical protein